MPLSSHQRDVPPAPPALHDRAMDNLRFIRETMANASSFTAVPGWGGVAMGVTALLASGLAWNTRDVRSWLVIWFCEAGVAIAIAATAMAVKLRRANETLLSGPGRKFVFGFAPPLVVGAVLTLALLRSEVWEALPGTWLSMYGAAVTAGGASSVRSVPVMGSVFVLLGCIALLVPVLGNHLMAAGFGILHIAFGFLIARRHGG